MTLTGQELLDYACTQFENGSYDAALEAFILAYTREYEKEWVLENIYSCYMAGNEVEFQKNYEHWNTGDKPKYEGLTLDFVPYREGEYYIYDKETQNFRGIFSANSIQNAVREKCFQEKEFSAIVTMADWDLRKMPELLMEAEYRKIYVICDDMGRCSSFFKIPELATVASNIMLFFSEQTFRIYFHTHTAEYLPRIYGGTEEEKKALAEIVEQEHTYRLTPEGRNTDNVLLTIGIPTYHRGHLLLKRIKNLLPMAYDAEIEIAVSKNGTELYEAEYRQAVEITDARFVYYDHKRTLNTVENWRYVVEMSHGKYVLFVSDEDDVVLQALEHYFRLLLDYPEVNEIRARTAYQYYWVITKRAYGKKGLEAFKNTFLQQNYLSGLIVRRKDFMQENFIKLDRFLDNPYYRDYSHDWWCAVLSRSGDNLREPVVLIQEGTSEANRDGEILLQPYAFYRNRLEEFEGIVDFLHWFMDGNTDGIIVGLNDAISKTVYLLDLARELKHDPEHFNEWIDRFVMKAMEAVDEFNLNEEQKAGVLMCLRNCCVLVLKKASDAE